MIKGLFFWKFICKCLYLFYILFLINCNQNTITMDWIDHGGRDTIDLQRLTHEAPTIFISTVRLIQKKATEYTKGDIQIPTVWSIKVKMSPLITLKGQKPLSFQWEGRYRPDYPDKLLEDLFWEKWEESNEKNVIVFLSNQNQNILHVELYSESVNEEILKLIRK
jgi:hypothetical protein